MMQSEAVLRCLEYILETEEQDFKENPSSHHVYFYALVATKGIAYAKEEMRKHG